MEQVKACSERLFYCGVILVSYYIFYTLRKIIICVSCFWCSKPAQRSYMAEGAFCLFDVIVKTGLLIWICTVLAEEKTYTCTEQNQVVSHYWWVCVLVVTMYFLYLLFGYCVCLIGCCGAIFVGIFLITRNREQRRRQMESLRERAPFV